MGGLRSRWVGLSIVLLSLVACGSDGGATAGAGDGTSGGTGPGSASASGGTTGAGSDGGAGPNGGPGAPTPVTTLFGVWQVSGKDARGAYTGQLELRDGGGGKAQAIRDRKSVV